MSTEEGNEAAEATPFQLIATLGIAGLVSGLMIVGIYELTLPRITANKAAALQAAVFQVVPGSTQVQPFRMKGDTLQADPNDELQGEAIYGAYSDEGRFVGYAIPMKGPGFQDTIETLIGYHPDQQMIVGMQVLESRETPGLGDKIYKDPDFIANFDDLSVKGGVELIKGKATADNQVEAITGATISSRSVVKLVNAGLDEWLPKLLEPGQEPALVAKPTAAPVPENGGE